jgi:hypothetical protein
MADGVLTVVLGAVLSASLTALCAGASGPGERLVDLRVEDHAGAARKAWPVTGGVPFPEGKVRDVTEIGLANAACQARVLSRWSDGSVRWALLDYQADIPANGEAKQTVLVGEAPAVPVAGNVVVETDEAITVDTGALKFSVSKSRFEFLRQVWVDLSGDGRYDADEQVVRPGGQDQFFDVQAKDPARPTRPYAGRDLLKGTSRSVKRGEPSVPGGPQWMRPEGGGGQTRVSVQTGTYAAEVVETGPWRTVVRLAGTFGPAGDGSEYHIWIHAYRGKPFLRVQHTFIFRGDPQTTNIRRMALVLPMNFAQPPRFTAAGLAAPAPLTGDGPAYLFATGPDDVFHLEYRGFPLDWQVGLAGSVLRKGAERTAGWIDLTGETFGVTASFRDMAYLYPKELSYDPKSRTLAAWIWPDHGGLVLDLRASGWPDGMEGVSFTHDVFYAFHPPAEAAGAATVAAALDDPPQPYADPVWYSWRGTRAAGMIMPFDDGQFPKTEAVLATRTAFCERSVYDFGWLGTMNYGDLMWAYKYNEPGPVLGTWGMGDNGDSYDGWRHGNTMMSSRMFALWLRTGEWRYWRAAEAHLKHVRDLLIKHWSSRNGKWNGLGRRHSAYWGAGPDDDRPGGTAMDGYGSNSLGHWLHWNLTGDWRTYEVMDELRGAWNRLGNSDLDQVSGGAYVGLKLLGTVPGYEAASAEAEQFLDTAVERTAKPGDHWRDSTWFLGYTVYFADTGVKDGRIAQALLDWWKAHKAGPDHWGLYWDRDALAAIYWAVDDPEVRTAIYNELMQFGTCETLTGARIDTQAELFKKHGLSDLFTCEMLPLSLAIAPAPWRAKDDIQQIQWDEVLSMAVLEHYRTGRK